MEHTPKCTCVLDLDDDIIFCALHAAAPKMLEALEAQGTTRQDDGEWHATGCTSSIACATWCQLARAAIKAARQD